MAGKAVYRGAEKAGFERDYAQGWSFTRRKSSTA
jgi:hypothetical protein